ncbi:MAG: HlyD family secretion protein, partial [bacterium]
MRLKNPVYVLVLIFLLSCSNHPQNNFIASGIMEGTSVQVAAQTAGLILEINVDEGQNVMLGQVLAVIDTEKLVYQLEQIQASIEELNVQHQISLNTLERANLEHNHLKTKYARYQDLYKKNSASKQVIDDLKNAFDVTTTQLENAQQSLHLIESKQKGLRA